MAIFSNAPEPEDNRGLIASCAAESLSNVPSSVSNSELWNFYDDIGEVRFGVNYIANALSRACLIAGEIDERGKVQPSDFKPVADAVASIRARAGGQAEVLRLLGLHLSVTGEAFLVSVEDEDGYVSWEVYCPSQINVRAGTVYLKSKGKTLNLGQRDVIRIYRKHPRDCEMADAPLKSSAMVLRELRLLTQAVSATCQSRLAGNGILVVPSELTTEMIGDSTDDADGARNVLDALYQNMSAPIIDPCSASAFVPLLLSTESENIGNIRHITMHSELDDQLPALREEAIRRFAQSIDLPLEILLGVGETSNYASTAVIGKQVLANHLKPLLKMITDMLTSSVLHPALKKAGVTDWQKYQVYFDLSDLERKEDQTQDVLGIYDRGLISDERARENLGYDEKARPNSALKTTDITAAYQAEIITLEEARRLLGVDS